MSDNAFAPPRANLETREGPEALWELTFKDLRKLYLASVNIHALAFFYALGALGLLAAGVMTMSDPSSSFRVGPQGANAVVLVIGLIMVAATVTSYTRPRWARVLGILLCVLLLLNFWLGTLIGIMGLIAYAQGGKLFGPDRLLHKDLAAVYKLRKKDKK